MYHYLLLRQAAYIRACVQQSTHGIYLPEFSRKLKRICALHDCSRTKQDLQLRFRRTELIIGSKLDRQENVR
jgi:hypothetical protein